MQQVADALRTAFDWCANNPNVLFWVILPSVLIFLWGLYKVLFITKVRNIDVQTIKELDEYQRLAVEENHSNEKRLKTYIGILDRETNVLIVMFYKYVLSHLNFDNVITTFTYSEYINVGRKTKRKRFYKEILVFSVIVFFAILWGALVSFSWATNGFHQITQNGSLVPEAISSITVVATVVTFFLATIVLLILYKRSVKRYKISLLNGLQETAPDFFNANDEYEGFALLLIENVFLSESTTAKLRSMIIKEGGQFRQALLDQAQDTATSEEDMDIEKEEEPEPEVVAEAPVIAEPVEEVVVEQPQEIEPVQEIQYQEYVEEQTYIEQPEFIQEYHEPVYVEYVEQPQYVEVVEMIQPEPMYEYIQPQYVQPDPVYVEYIQPQQIEQQYVVEPLPPTIVEEAPMIEVVETIIIEEPKLIQEEPSSKELNDIFKKFEDIPHEPVYPLQPTYSHEQNDDTADDFVKFLVEKAKKENARPLAEDEFKPVEKKIIEEPVEYIVVDEPKEKKAKKVFLKKKEKKEGIQAYSEQAVKKEEQPPAPIEKEAAPVIVDKPKKQEQEEVVEFVPVVEVAPIPIKEEKVVVEKPKVEIKQKQANQNIKVSSKEIESGGTKKIEVEIVVVQQDAKPAKKDSTITPKKEPQSKNEKAKEKPPAQKAPQKKKEAPVTEQKPKKSTPTRQTPAKPKQAKEPVVLVKAKEPEKIKKVQQEKKPKKLGPKVVARTTVQVD